MSEKELNSYRFSPEQEPTDEMLEQIMREVAEEAKLAKQAKWAHAIEMALNENMQVIEK